MLFVFFGVVGSDRLNVIVRWKRFLGFVEVNVPSSAPCREDVTTCPKHSFRMGSQSVPAPSLSLDSKARFPVGTLNCSVENCVSVVGSVPSFVVWPGGDHATESCSLRSSLVAAVSVVVEGFAPLAPFVPSLNPADPERSVAVTPGVVDV